MFLFQSIYFTHLGKRTSDFVARRASIAEFNAKNKHRKRGISMLPSKYGIAFTFNTLNQGKTKNNKQ